MEYDGYITRNVAISFIIQNTTAVCLRFASQRLGGRKLGIDDYLVVPGLLLCLGLYTAVLGTICCLSTIRVDS